mmetsp:Transcript_138/g.177  ORF Transcript_138/g.177 Transcript_138/m.177 type:complete len:270 (+) Transcript_138:808-1617(+)|eukprot:CAMPEP_0205834028 /NCGR_PEP_ID=MMETSP0206-20130828/50466_1 /ASSEMBLY_ACC=CAM_ASM_000279 /TAXON_ID=36767 /ORGANISM="Euplotes focardii, Strain TN1" /LENGTH=269 /DNA_ID=CAMNT_0053140861 /DNA_START=1527 /DNA_END=2336 /DNA_ORIENTATION=+
MAPKEEAKGKIISSKVDSIIKGFAEFENGDSNNSKQDLMSNFEDPKITKIHSQVLNFNDNEFELKGIGKKISFKRDRAQSENDTELIFNTERYTPSPTKFRKREPYKEKEDKKSKEKMHSDIMVLHRGSTSSEEDVHSGTEEDEEEGSPSFIRAQSLPRMKILENNKGMPKISEEEEKDIFFNRKDDSTSFSPDSGPDLSILSKKFSPLKILRVNSSDMKEKELKDSPYDEQFFYYFQTYLNEAVEKIVCQTNKSKVMRGRSHSDVQKM